VQFRVRWTASDGVCGDKEGFIVFPNGHAKLFDDGIDKLMKLPSTETLLSERYLIDEIKPRKLPNRSPIDSTSSRVLRGDHATRAFTKILV
jgi:hypothetical protein